MPAWKEKILDYEIETPITEYEKHPIGGGLKRKDSRLRDWNCMFGKRIVQIKNDTWKEKILDYEIETFICMNNNRLKRGSWKEKILDYEIETICLCCGSHISIGGDLKRKDSRLRDWNSAEWSSRGTIYRTWKEKILDYEIET